MSISEKSYLDAKSKGTKEDLTEENDAVRYKSAPTVGLKPSKVQKPLGAQSACQGAQIVA